MAKNQKTSQKIKADSPPWYQINAKANNEAEILIYEQIGESWFGGGIGAKQFAKDLKALGDVKNITVRINSPGGSVFEGNAIYNTLRAHKAKKTMIVDGLAASIASVILMAGDEILMPANSMVMIHDPWMLAMGNSEEMRKAADMLDKVKDSILTSYRRSGLDDATLSKMMADETWMTAEEAVDLGFADKVTGSVKAAAMAFDLSHFRNVPENLKNLVVSTEKPAEEAEEIVNDQGEKDMTITLDELKNKAPELITALKAEGKQEAMAEIESVKTQAKADGAKEERERIQAIENKGKLLPGHDDLVAQMKFDGKTTPSEASERILEAEAKVRATTMADIKADAPAALEQPATSAVEPSANAEKSGVFNEEACKAKFEKDAKLQSEFRTVQAYVAFEKAQASGQARIMSR